MFFSCRLEETQQETNPRNGHPVRPLHNSCSAHDAKQPPPVRQFRTLSYLHTNRKSPRNERLIPKQLLVSPAVGAFDLVRAERLEVIVACKGGGWSQASVTGTTLSQVELTTQGVRSFTLEATPAVVSVSWLRLGCKVPRHLSTCLEHFIVTGSHMAHASSGRIVSARGLLVHSEIGGTLICKQQPPVRFSRLFPGTSSRDPSPLEKPEPALLQWTTDLLLPEDKAG